MKIGFIDLYLDEWHANKYPGWLKEQSGGEAVVAYAWAAVEKEGKLSSAAWCEQFGVELLGSAEEVVEKSDCIMVLAPDDPEVHLQLAEPALKSGKPVFVDKTFADTADNAKKMFEIAAAYHTPLYTSSALRYSEKLQAVLTDDIGSVAGFGPAVHIKDYMIHMLEPLDVLMGMDVAKVMYTGKGPLSSFTLVYRDGRTANLHLSKLLYGYAFKVAHSEKCEALAIDDNFWFGAVEAVLQFFRNGQAPVAAEDTIAIMTVKDACFRAMETPLEWVKVAQ